MKDATTHITETINKFGKKIKSKIPFARDIKIDFQKHEEGFLSKVQFRTKGGLKFMAKKVEKNADLALNKATKAAMTQWLKKAGKRQNQRKGVYFKDLLPT